MQGQEVATGRNRTKALTGQRTPKKRHLVALS
jgi:hypothetical protein